MKTAFQKKAYSILTALVLLLTACTGAVFSSSRAAALELEGTGKADNPYLLSTAAELLEFAEKAAADPSICAMLTADISLEGETWTPIGSYAGTFDGNYHCISNLQCSGGSNLGMFAKLSGTVQKLGLTNVHIQGKNTVGGIAALCSGTITDSFCEGDITASRDFAGGLAGQFQAEPLCKTPTTSAQLPQRAQSAVLPDEAMHRFKTATISEQLQKQTLLPKILPACWWAKWKVWQTHRFRIVSTQSQQAVTLLWEATT